MSNHGEFKNLFDRIRRINSPIYFLYRFFHLFPELLRRHVFYFARNFIRINFYNFGRFMANLPSFNFITKKTTKLQTNSEAGTISVNHRLPILLFPLYLIRSISSLLSIQPQAPRHATITRSFSVSQRFDQLLANQLQFITELYLCSFNIHLI